MYATTVTESNLALFTKGQANESERLGIKATNMTLFRKPTDGEDGSITLNHLVAGGSGGGCLDTRYFYGSDMGGSEETK